MSILEDLVEKIHASGYQGVLTVTGGGTGAFDRLLRFGGGSATVLDLGGPYGEAAFQEHTKGWKGKAVSTEAARYLAMIAFQRAQKLSKHAYSDKLFGVAATSSLSKKGPEREGRLHRACLAFQTVNTTWAVELDLPAGSTRPQQEDMVSRAFVLATAKACGVIDEKVAFKELERMLAVSEMCATNPKYEWHHTELTVVKQECVVGPSDWAPLMHPTIMNACRADRESRFASSPSTMNWGTLKEPPKAILAGSFNPLHEGHMEMVLVGAKTLGLSIVDVLYEIAVRNADKPALDFFEIERRANQFATGALVLSNAATFVEKSELYPGAVFLVGADTLARILDPRFYGGEDGRDDAIERIKGRGCRFLVFERKINGITQKEWLAHELASKFGDEIATFVPESEFLMNVSSTEKRAEAK